MRTWRAAQWAGAVKKSQSPLAFLPYIGCLFVHGTGHKFWKKVAVVVSLYLQFNSQLALMDEFANLKPQPFLASSHNTTF